MYEKWHSYHRGYLPTDREMWKGSLIGARDREYAVCRVKYKMLQNSRSAREPPRYFVCDEQLCPYFGHMSGLKKRLPKKKIEGIEYFALATSNKDYEGWKGEERAEPLEGESVGKIIRQADPVSGGYKLNYIMGVGPRYEPGATNPSKIFGSMLLLIFSCGEYLRYGASIAVTDSAYAFVEAMLYLSLWGIKWVSSIRLKQRRGFLGVQDFKDAALAKEKEKAKKKKKIEEKDPLEGKKSEKRKHGKEVSEWEKANKDASKGTS